MFQRIETWTYDLQQGDNLAILQAAGFHWIRRIPQRFERMVRNPTIGCFVELYKVEHVGSVRVDSPAGRKLIGRLCYF